MAWAEPNWIAVSNPATNYRDYYDLDGTNTTTAPSYAQGWGIHAPSKDGTPMNLRVIGSRLGMTTIRNGFLWACQAVGLSGTNGLYAGNATGTNVNRTGVQWLKLRVDAAGGTLTYNTHGRVYDKTASTNAFYYYFPSLAVNCAGDMVMGFSGSSATNYISAYYWWRLAGSEALNIPRVIRAGMTNYLDSRWGDYSATTSDPSDDWNFWTVQQYADPPGDSDGLFPWKTIVVKMRPHP